MTIQTQDQIAPQSLVAVMVNIMVLVVVAAWAFSVIRKVIRGEEIEAPLPMVVEGRR